ncbi:MAG: hypothetical protein VKK32_08110 [Candidatus Melainabacteria bacterium]|nr:hypothetical protein [Candidatus Melainabacteria bacterium]
MAPELFGQISSRIYASMGANEGDTPQMGANEGHTPQADSNQPWNFRAQAYIGESKPNEQVDSSSRQLGAALAANPQQLS